MTHKCGQCGQSFNSDEGYLEHTCPASGFTPTDALNLGEDFALIQQAALERGAENSEQ